MSKFSLSKTTRQHKKGKRSNNLSGKKSFIYSISLNSFLTITTLIDSMKFDKTKSILFNQIEYILSIPQRVFIYIIKMFKIIVLPC